MYILGLSPGHNSSAALLKDGVIRYAMAEERLSRFKGDTRFPKLAIKRILEMEGIGLSDIDHFVIHGSDVTSKDIHGQNFVWDDTPRAETTLYKLEKQQILDYLIYLIPKIGDLHRKKRVSKGRELFFRNISDFGISKEKLTSYEHHLTHAASAYFTSKVDPCLIVTLDASGDGLSATVNIGKGGEIKRIAENSVSECSAGAVYSSITRLLGYIPNRHEGKILGLAAYGDVDKYYDRMRPLMSFDPVRKMLIKNLPEDTSLTGKLKLRLMWMKNVLNGYKNDSYMDYCNKYFSDASREDLSAALQKRLEDVVVDYIGVFVEETGLRDLVLAGGVFSNVKLNQRIYEKLSLNSIYIHPDMTDGGCALGGAFLKWNEINGNSSSFRNDIEHVYWGQAFENGEIEKIIKKSELKAIYVENIEEKVTSLLVDRKIIGHFGIHGMEYGPRALGNRSILASPVDSEINTWLNNRLNRTEFMPFAPVVLEEHASKILKNYTNGNSQAAKFMTITFDVTDFCKEKAPAIVHIDGTARPQTINEEQNPTYYNILKHYYERTGIPCIINTSFNVHEEPIVCTPEDAIKSFKEGRIDVLVMGNWLIYSQDE